MRGWLFALALAASPVQAGVYGPVLPEVPKSLPSEFEVGPDESVNEAAARYENYTRQAHKWRGLLVGTLAADVATTCAILSRGGHEANPIYGRNASCGKIAGINAGIGLVSWVLLSRLARRNPEKARDAAKLTTIIRGLVVGWNLGQLTK